MFHSEATAGESAMAFTLSFACFRCWLLLMLWMACTMSILLMWLIRCAGTVLTSALLLDVQDPLGDGNQASVIALDIRKRKGLKPNPSPLNEYEDKL